MVQTTFVYGPLLSNMLSGSSIVSLTYSNIEQSEDGSIVYTPPPLDDIWLDEGKRREKRLFLIPHHNVRLVPWSWMMSRSALLCLLMMIRSALLL